MRWRQPLPGEKITKVNLESENRSAASLSVAAPQLVLVRPHVALVRCCRFVWLFNDWRRM